MKVESYSFGAIKINGKKYRKDVIIFPDHVFSPWWRKEGHSLSPKDLKKVFEYGPELVIIGRGAHGVMKVPGSTIQKIKDKDIEYEDYKTGEAVEKYNQYMKEGKDVVACLHLTC